MSICTCSNCARYIDSDDDPECFVEVGNMRRYHETIILCETCREERDDEREWQESQADRAITEMEKETK